MVGPLTKNDINIRKCIKLLRTNLLLGSDIRNYVILIYPMIINDIDIAVKVSCILYFTDIFVML